MADDSIYIVPSGSAPARVSSAGYTCTFCNDVVHLYGGSYSCYGKSGKAAYTLHVDQADINRLRCLSYFIGMPASRFSSQNAGIVLYLDPDRGNGSTDAYPLYDAMFPSVFKDDLSTGSCLVFWSNMMSDSYDYSSLQLSPVTVDMMRDPSSIQPGSYPCQYQAMIEFEFLRPGSPGAALQPVPVIRNRPYGLHMFYHDSSAGNLVVDFMTGKGSGDTYNGFFKISGVDITPEPTEEVPLPEPAVSMLCSGGYYCVNGQNAGLVTTDAFDVVVSTRSATYHAVLHHDNVSGTGAVEWSTNDVRSLPSSTDNDAYWYIGSVSFGYNPSSGKISFSVVQQSHGVPSLLIIGDCTKKEQQ